MSAEDLSWAAETLVEAERRRCVSRVCSVDAEDAVAKGDNYGSDIRRLKMTVVLHSGEVQQRSLIYKAMPDTPQRKDVLKKFGNFANEAKVFVDVLSELEVILRDKEANAELLWPEFYGVKRKYEGLLFEDLRVKGFKMAEKQKGLDFEHAALTVRSLAKFHALAAILNERGDLNSKLFESAFLSNDDDTDKFHKSAFEALADVLATKWKNEWTQYAERLRNSLDTIMTNFKRALKRENDDKFYTLVHGDCWVNNLMFRYDRKGSPESVRFVDFQICSYNNPVLDLQYFFLTSLNLETRPHKAKLLQMYHSSLEENLAYYGYAGKVPTYKDLLECFRGAAYYGLCVGIAALPFMCLPSERAPDMEDLSEKWLKNEDLKLSGYDYEGENFVSTIKYILKEAVDDGLIQ